MGVHAKSHMLYLVGLIDSVRYDLSCSYTLLPTPCALYLCDLAECNNDLVKLKDYGIGRISQQNVQLQQITCSLQIAI